MSFIAQQLGFVLGGFPRTIPQADFLSTHTDIHVVVNITLREDILIRKIAARRVCAVCENGYNLATFNEPGIDMPPLLPKIEGICDKCGGALAHRAEDKEETVKKRMAEYNEKTQVTPTLYPVISMRVRAGYCFHASSPAVD